MRIISWLHEHNVHVLHPTDRHFSMRQGYINEYNLVSKERLAVREMGVVSTSDRVNGLYMLMPKARRIRDYKTYEVHKHYGLSLVEFLRLPRDMINIIIEDLQNDVILDERRRALAEAKEKEAERQMGLAGLHKIPKLPGQ